MFESKIPLGSYIDLKGPCFDNSRKPIYIMKFPQEFDRDTMVAAYEELLHATASVIGPYGMIADITDIRAGNAEGRKLAASYADKFETVVSATKHCVGLAVVASRPWQRGLFTAYNWLRNRKQAYPAQTFGSQREAVVWLQDMLAVRLEAG